MNGEAEGLPSADRPVAEDGAPERRVIRCFAHFGPMFGDDFRIKDNCNTATNWANFPYNYNVEGSPKNTTVVKRLTGHSRERPTIRILG